MQTVYQIIKNADFTEGRGPMIPINIAFENEVDAYTYIGRYCIDPYDQSRSLNGEAKGRMMCDAGWYKVKELFVFISPEDAVAQDEKMRVAKLLERFKPEERELLRRNLSVV